MCETPPCAHDIATAFEDSDTRWNAANRIDNGTPQEFDLECVDELAKTLAKYVGHENKLTRLQAWEILETLSDAYPVAVANNFARVIDHTDSEGEAAPEELCTVLMNLVEAPVEIAPHLSITQIEVFANAEDADVRATYASLLGGKPTVKNTKRLIEMEEYEVPKVKSKINNALENILRTALEEVSPEKRSEGNLEASRAIRHLARHKPTVVAAHSGKLFDLLETEAGDVAADAFEYLITTPTVESRSTVSRLTDLVDLDETACQAKRQQAEQALSAVIQADAGGEQIDHFVQKFSKWLESDEEAIREHAIRQLRTLVQGFPGAVESELSRLSNLATEESSRRADLASDLVARYSQSQSHGAPSYLEQILNTNDDDTATQALTELTDTLLYREPGTTRLEPMDLDPSTKRAIENIRDAAESSRTVPVIWPIYAPSVVILIALEFLFKNLETGEDVVLFSPGGTKHWGDKGELREEYKQYAVDTGTGDNRRIIPLPDLIPHASITGGSVTEQSKGITETRFILTKDFDELEELENPACILLNLTSRTKSAYEAQIDEVMEEFEDVPVLPVYSNYTKHEFEERRAPRYGPPKQLGDVNTLPGVDALERALDHTEPGDAITRMPQNEGQNFTRLANPGSIKILGVDDGGLKESLESGYELSAELREYDHDRAASRIFSRQMMFERFPVPFDRYNNWARSQRDGFFAPRTTGALIDNLEAYGDKMHGTGAALNLFDAVENLRHASRDMEQSTPMYEALSARIADALTAEERIAVFLPKPTWRRAVEFILLEDDVITEADLESGSVTITSPDKARSLDHQDRMLIVGPQRPQYAGFYCHPAVEKTTILMYQTDWLPMVERDLKNFVSLLNESSPGEDYHPYTMPEIKVDRQPSLAAKIEEAQAAQEADNETSPAGTVEHAETGKSSASPTTASTGVDKGELVALFDQARSRDYESTSDRYESGEHREYRITLKTGDELEERQRVLRKRPDPDTRGRYHWVSPRSLEEGEEIVVFDEDTESRLWDEWLDGVYDEEMSEMNIFEDINTWYDALTAILDTTIESTGAKGPLSSDVRQHILATTGDHDREQETVWRWFKSVERAKDGLDLARSPSLTIGPQRAADIDTIGQIFDRDELTEECAIEIEESMRRVRAENASQGHEFRAHIKQRMNTLDDSEIRDAATVREVVSVTEL